MLSPMDVTLADDTILQPDLLYVSKGRRHIIKERVEGPPDLAIEIISGTGRRDRVEKLDLYARYGVAEYWIVDPDSQLIEFLINENGRYVVQSPANDRYQSPRLPEVVIEIAEFWREVDRRWRTNKITTASFALRKRLVVCSSRIRRISVRASYVVENSP